MGPHGMHDTIPVLVYKINSTDSFAFFYMPTVAVVGVLTPQAKVAIKEQKRLRRYVERVYPMAVKASEVVTDLRMQLQVANSRKDKRHMRKVTEKTMKEEFTDKIKNLYIDEGKILCKLIYRETNETAYDIVKEFKSGVNARFWQTVSFFFNGNLKSTYDPTGTDAQIETIVLDIQRRNRGFSY